LLLPANFFSQRLPETRGRLWDVSGQASKELLLILVAKIQALDPKGGQSLS